jgi:hypothetical protein
MGGCRVPGGNEGSRRVSSPTVFFFYFSPLSFTNYSYLALLMMKGARDASRAPHTLFFSSHVTTPLCNDRDPRRVSGPWYYFFRTTSPPY